MQNNCFGLVLNRLHIIRSDTAGRDDGQLVHDKGDAGSNDGEEVGPSSNHDGCVDNHGDKGGSSSQIEEDEASCMLPAGA